MVGMRARGKARPGSRCVVEPRVRIQARRVDCGPGPRVAGRMLQRGSEGPAESNRCREFWGLLVASVQTIRTWVLACVVLCRPVAASDTSEARSLTLLHFLPPCRQQQGQLVQYNPAIAAAGGGGAVDLGAVSSGAASSGDQLSDLMMRSFQSLLSSANTHPHTASAGALNAAGAVGAGGDVSMGVGLGPLGLGHLGVSPMGLMAGDLSGALNGLQLDGTVSGGLGYR